MSATAAPELTVCSATLTQPIPMTRSRTPSNPAFIHCRGVGNDAPNSFITISKLPPAASKRVASRKRTARLLEIDLDREIRRAPDDINRHEKSRRHHDERRASGMQE